MEVGSFCIQLKGTINPLNCCCILLLLVSD